MTTAKPKPKFFATPATFRAWLDAHHNSSAELLVGFYKRGSGTPSITWPESVDQALCFGWIDGIRRRIDDVSYTIRFTPRNARSTWSGVNVRRVGELTKVGLMAPAGLAAFERRPEATAGAYSYEQRHELTLDPAYTKRLRANKEANAFFEAQPAGYRTAATFWVMSAKHEATRLKRLATLIEDSAARRPIAMLRRRTGNRDAPG